ncbi:MAG: DNA topoisomerase, partial [Candidatus Eisenbacteria bacterium]|nr:DNA topoisomerase [Candidatus Eisenbacteria bacterium]
AQEIAPLPSATVRSVETKEVRTSPPPLFNLLALQKEANKRFGLAAAKVLEIAQSLYERKLLTYPRTESRHLSTDMVKDLKRHVAAIEHLYPTAVDLAEDALVSGHQLGKAYVDDTKLTDHHAIIPTPQTPGPDLAGDERKVYDLVARRFLGIFLPAKVADETVALFDLGAHTLQAHGTLLKDPGWTIVEETSAVPAEEDEDIDRPDTQALPALTTGQVVPKQGHELLEKRTKPPRPYTDATLLDAMKLAGRLVENAELAEYMKENGLGTPATRAAIIEKLLDVGYIERRKKALLPTPKGVALIRQVHPSLSDPLLTAQWERHLADIENGDASASDFETLVSSFVATLIPEVLAMPPVDKPEKPSLGTCPACKEGQVRALPKSNGWGCSRYKEGCSFVLWAEIAGKKLGEDVARELLASGVTAKAVDGFTSKDKKKFSAKLRLDENHHVAFVFEERPPAKELGSCPACKQGSVHATAKGWGCSRYKDGCSLTIWHEYHGKKISETVAREILTNGVTSRPLDFTSKDGKKQYQARLRFDENWRVVLAFDEAKSAEPTPPPAA